MNPVIPKSFQPDGPASLEIVKHENFVSKGYQTYVDQLVTQLRGNSEGTELTWAELVKTIPVSKKARYIVSCAVKKLKKDFDQVWKRQRISTGERGLRRLTLSEVANFYKRDHLPSMARKSKKAVEVAVIAAKHADCLSNADKVESNTALAFANIEQLLYSKKTHLAITNKVVKAQKALGPGDVSLTLFEETRTSDES